MPHRQHFVLIPHRVDLQKLVEAVLK